MDHHVNPLHCIVPPHVLENIAVNGSDQQRRVALASIAISTRLRERRALMTRIMSSGPTPVATGKSRAVYSAENGTTLPGTLLRDEGGPATGDPAADEAYDGAGATYDLYWDVYQRDSVDGNGLKLLSSVHYDRQYDNAFWDGQQMVYGDGDGQLFNRFTLALDVIGHELTHGVTQYTSKLDYTNQPGALNESFSDVFGSLVKQRKRQQTADQADWLIGAGLFTAKVNGVALRSMRAPGTAYNDPVLGKDPQPGTMSGYVNTTADNGGVHINSGIPNHAFYLIAAAIGGYAWEKAGNIWYVSARDKFTSSTNFQAAADITFEVAGQLYGSGGMEQLAVQNGWQQVGITVSSQPQTQSDPGGCLAAPLAMLRSLFTGK